MERWIWGTGQILSGPQGGKSPAGPAELPVFHRKARVGTVSVCPSVQLGGCPLSPLLRASLAVGHKRGCKKKKGFSST